MAGKGLTRFSRLTPLLRITGKTLEIFVSTIRAFRISMYSFDSMHWLSALVILELHFQWTFKETQKYKIIKYDENYTVWKTVNNRNTLRYQASHFSWFSSQDQNIRENTMISSKKNWTQLGSHWELMGTVTTTELVYP